MKFLGILIKEKGQEAVEKENRQNSKKYIGLGFRRGGTAVPADQPPPEPTSPLTGEGEQRRERRENF